MKNETVGLNNNDINTSETLLLASNYIPLSDPIAVSAVKFITMMKN